jgi:hypothetical protein
VEFPSGVFLNLVHLVHLIERDHVGRVKFSRNPVMRLSAQDKRKL